jgi:hypothetical protein
MFNERTDLPQQLYNLDLLDGSPPCSSFSMAGNREKDWGKKKVFREGQANDMLIIKGGVPGPIGGLIRLENIGKIKGYVAPPEEKEDEEEVENVKGEEVEKTENVSSEENAVQAEEVKAEEETTETKVEDKEEVAAEATVAEEKVEAPVAEETQVEEKENA